MAPTQNIRSAPPPHPSTTFNPRASPGPAMKALAELTEKTREVRTSLMATTVLVDASLAVCNEWVSVITDYVGPQVNHITGKFLDHQVRNGGSLTNLRSLICIRHLAPDRVRHVRIAIHAPKSHSLQTILQPR